MKRLLYVAMMVMVVSFVSCGRKNAKPMVNICDNVGEVFFDDVETVENAVVEVVDPAMAEMMSEEVM